MPDIVRSIAEREGLQSLQNCLSPGKDGSRLIAVDRDTTPNVGMHEIRQIAVGYLCPYKAMAVQFI